MACVHFDEHHLKHLVTLTTLNAFEWHNKILYNAMSRGRINHSTRANESKRPTRRLPANLDDLNNKIPDWECRKISWSRYGLTKTDFFFVCLIWYNSISSRKLLRNQHLKNELLALSVLILLRASHCNFHDEYLPSHIFQSCSQSMDNTDLSCFMALCRLFLESWLLRKRAPIMQFISHRQ